jgi:multiple sugar transport system permease protein
MTASTATARRSKQRGKGSSLRREEAFWGLALILPSTLGILIFAILPILGSFGISFTDWGGLSLPHWTGLENYKLALNDTKAIESIGRTLIFTVISVPMGLTVAIVLATLIQNLRLENVRTFFRTLYYLPMVTIGVATALLFTVIFSAQGPVNLPLRLFGIQGPAWLGSPDTVLTAIAIYSVWQGAGSSIILFLAALANVPKELYEAAQIDGAQPFRLFWHITLPMISPTIFLVLILSLIGSLQVFEAVLVMSRGGPGDSSMTIAMYIYKTGFNYFKMGYATALAWLLSLALVVLMVLQWRLQKAWVYYE